MDRSRFDALTRSLAASPSRRTVIRSTLAALGGGALASLTSGSSDAAPVGRRPTEICRKGADCSSGLCGPADRTGRRRCLCSTADQCPQPTDDAYVAVCSVEGLCGFEEEGGCFVGGTSIAIPGGASRSIELFLPGDEVLCADGSIGHVLELERQPIRNRFLYAVNDSGFFFSPEHVFMTADGWRAIDYATARRDDPTIQIEPLRVGDTIFAMSHAPVPAMAGGGRESRVPIVHPTLVTSLTGRWVEPETEIYNLLLADENLTYIANGFAVHD